MRSHESSKNKWHNSSLIILFVFKLNEPAPLERPCEHCEMFLHFFLEKVHTQVNLTVLRAANVQHEVILFHFHF